MTIGHMSQIILDAGGYEPYVSIRFNMTFPHLPCKYVSAELQDVYGKHTLNESTSSNVDVRIFKWRVVDEGKRRVSVMEEHKSLTKRELMKFCPMITTYTLRRRWRPT